VDRGWALALDGIDWGFSGFFHVVIFDAVVKFALLVCWGFLGEIVGEI